MPMAQVVGSDDIAVCADADVVMFTAGAKQKPGQSRIELAEATIGLVRKVLPPLVEVAPDAVYVMVTNPVDVVTYAALQISGLPPTQLFGSGTVLDSSRLRYLIAQHTGVAVQNVHAYIAGEHGDSELPLWGSASIGSVPLLEWTGARRRRSADRRGPRRASRARSSSRRTGSSRARARRTTRSRWPGRGSSRRSLKDEGRVLPVSSLLDDYYGISDVCLSVPAIVGARRRGRTARGAAVDDELAGRRASADAVRAVARQFGFERRVSGCGRAVAVLGRDAASARRRASRTLVRARRRRRRVLTLGGGHRLRSDVPGRAAPSRAVAAPAGASEAAQHADDATEDRRLVARDRRVRRVVRHAARRGRRCA